MLRLTGIIFFILFIAPLSNLVLAQQKQTLDSLLQITNSNKSDKEIVDAYVKIAKEYHSSDSIKTYKYAFKAIELAEKNKYPEGKIDAWHYMGSANIFKGNYKAAEVIFQQMIDQAVKCQYSKGEGNGYNGLGRANYQSNYEKALEVSSKAITIFKELGDNDGLARSNVTLGLTYQTQGNYDKAFEYYFESLKIFEKVGDKEYMAKLYNNIAIVYKRQGNYEKALSYYTSSLKIFAELRNKDGIAGIYNNIGALYNGQKNYEKAKDSYFKSLKSHEELGNKKGMAFNYFNLGKTFLLLGYPDKSVEYAFKTLEMSELNGYRYIKAISSILLGQVYREKKQWELSQQYLQQGLKIAQEIGTKHNIRNSAEQLALLEKDMGNYKSAYEYQILFKQMADSILNEAQTKKLTRLEAEYEFEQEKDSIQFANTAQRVALEKDIKQRETVQFATLVVLSLVVALAGILFLFFRAKSRANRLLKVKSDELAKSNKKLERSNLEVKKQAENILLLNRLLEKDLDDASKDLLVKNQKLGEYAFYNSHKTRAPLARILGLIDLLKPGQVDAETAQVLEMLLESTKDLDKIVAEMNDILSEVDMHEDVKKDAEKANKGSNEFF